MAYVITIDASKCDGDGECSDVCAAGILGLQEVNGKKISQVTGSADDCLGCLSCQTTCAHEAITVVDM